MVMTLSIFADLTFLALILEYVGLDLYLYEMLE